MAILPLSHQTVSPRHCRLASPLSSTNANTATLNWGRIGGLLIMLVCLVFVLVPSAKSTMGITHAVKHVNNAISDSSTMFLAENLIGSSAIGAETDTARASFAALRGGHGINSQASAADDSTSEDYEDDLVDVIST